MVCFLLLKMDQTQKLSSITVVFAAIFNHKNIWRILQSYKFLRAPLCVYRSARKIFICCRFLECVHGATEKSYVGNKCGPPVQSIPSPLPRSSMFFTLQLHVLGFCHFFEGLFQGPVDLLSSNSKINSKFTLSFTVILNS